MTQIDAEKGGEIRAGDVAYEAIKSAIVMGEFAPREHLGETAVASRLGVSRTPVREAFRRLEAEGLVDITPHLGVRVAQWSSADIDHNIAIRVLLEAHAAGEAASKISEADVERLHALALRIQEKSNRSLVSREAADARCMLNGEFHAIIIDASGNRQLKRILAGIVEFPLIKWNFRGFLEHEIHRSDAQHLELVEAMRIGHAEWASVIMKSHILSARHAMLRLLRGETGAGRERTRGG
jgi:DNA-binding GntR family transcriptional regulator